MLITTVAHKIRQVITDMKEPHYILKFICGCFVWTWIRQRYFLAIQYDKVGITILQYCDSYFSGLYPMSIYLLLPIVIVSKFYYARNGSFMIESTSLKFTCLVSIIYNWIYGSVATNFAPSGITNSPRGSMGDTGASSRPFVKIPIIMMWGDRNNIINFK